MAIYNYDYNKISKAAVDFQKESETTINTKCPSPTENDYKNGFIIRYFAQKVNDKNGYIYELTDSAYLNLTMNPFYITTSIRWRISGTDAEIENSNYNSVKLGMKKIPLLIKYLPNYLQFKKKK